MCHKAILKLIHLSFTMDDISYTIRSCKIIPQAIMLPPLVCNHPQMVEESLFSDISGHVSTFIFPMRQKTWEGNLMPIGGCVVSILLCKFQPLLPMHNSYFRYCHHSPIAESEIQLCLLKCPFGHTCDSSLVLSMQ